MPMTPADPIASSGNLTVKAFLEQAAANHEEYEDKIVVVKFGGEIYDDKTALTDLLNQVRMLQVFGARVVLVHGGAKQIDALYAERNITPVKIEGERQCDQRGLEASFDALSKVNADIVERYNELPGKFTAEGFGADEENLIVASPKFEGYYTGGIEYANTLRIKLGLAANPNRIYVIHPICSDGKGGVLNVNADYVAVELAKSLNAKRLIMCTNTPGILDAEKKLISHISPTGIENLIQEGVINGGMIPKVRSLIDAVKSGVEGAVILNPASLSTELFTTNGAGTLIERKARMAMHAPQAPAA